MATPRNNVIAVSTTAILLEGTQFPGWILQNLGTSPIFIGDAGVTTATGWRIDAGGYYSPPEVAHKQLSNRLIDRFYGISTSSQDVRVLVQGKNLNQ